MQGEIGDSAELDATFGAAFFVEEMWVFCLKEVGDADQVGRCEKFVVVAEGQVVALPGGDVLRGNQAGAAEGGLQGEHGAVFRINKHVSEASDQMTFAVIDFGSGDLVAGDVHGQGARGGTVMSLAEYGGLGKLNVGNVK